MTQSTSLSRPASLHVALIMDGNGRWATARGLPRVAGHREGALAVQRTVEASLTQPIEVLTLFAFSGDNWRRPTPEVSWLLRLFTAHFRAERRRCAEAGIRVSVIGRRDRLPHALVREIEATERATASGGRLHLRIAVDYSARWEIAAASRRLGPALTAASLDSALAAASPGPPVPPVDLLIRTGGEQRLSDFLLWESAYAELLFLDIRWPDFTAAHLQAALAAYHRRTRRFGGLVDSEIPSTGVAS